MRRLARARVRVTTLLVTAGLAIGATVIASTPASAATGLTGSYTFSLQKCFYSTKIRTAVIQQVSGKVNYTYNSGVQQPGGIPIYTFTKITVTDPLYIVSTLDACSFGTAKNMWKVDMEQAWYSTTCSANSGLSVSAPWGISIQPTFSCGTTKTKQYDTSYGSGHFYEQNNSGSDAAMKGWIQERSSKPCLAVRLTATAYNTQTSSDSVTIGDNETFKTC